jgi:Protein of unknown function (DUF3667)
MSGSTPASCANCGAPFVPERRRFCPECGQETRVLPPTLGEFVQQFGGAYFSTEGALWRTLKLLLLKPGELTRQYLAGRRKHYVLPLRLYLSISLVALLLLRLLASEAMSVGMPGSLDLRKGEYSIIQFGDGTGTGMRDGVFYCTNLPQWFCKRVQRRLDNDPKGLQREAAALGERFISNMGAAMFLMVPLFALFQKAVYWNRGMRYTEHLVFALHLHAFWFLALMFTLPDQQWLSGLAFIAVPVYAFMALKRVYGGRWVWRWLRAGVVSLLYFVTLLFVMVGVIMWSLVF